MNRLKMKQGFTMVELLVVLVIVAILAAVATPILLGNRDRSIASEAVATMSLIRQTEREYSLRPGGNLFAVAAGNIDNALPTNATAAGVPNPVAAGLGINLGVTQYFSNAAFTVTGLGGGGAGASGQFINPGTQGFLITATGANSAP